LRSLPVFNAIFDWLSYGTTIWLVVQGRARGGLWPLWLALVDIAAAAAIMLGLAVTLTLLFALINALRPDDLVDIETLLTGLRDDPAGHYWIIAMVASTLLPTFLHLCLGFVSVVTWVRAEMWLALVGRLDAQEAPMMPLFSSAAVTVILVLYVTVPIGLIMAAGYAIWTYGGHVRVAYADICLWLANAVGAI
jgi:hypothetical protein